MKLVLATLRHMPPGWAIVIALATAEEVREMEWSKPDDEIEIPDQALINLINAVRT